MYKLVLRVNELPPLNISADHGWQNRFATRKRWGWLMRAALGRKPKPPVPLPLTRLTFVRCSSVEPEYDNLVSSFKGPLDCLRVKSRLNPYGLGIIEDDKPENIVGIPVYGWDKTRPKQGHVIITVEEIECTDPKGIRS